MQLSIGVAARRLLLHAVTRTLRSAPLLVLLALLPASAARPQHKRGPPRLTYDAEFFDNYVTPLTPALRGRGTPRPAAVGAGVTWGPGVRGSSTRAPWAAAAGGDTVPMASALRAQAGIGYGYGGASLGYGSNGGFGSASYSSPSIGNLGYHGGPSLGYYGDSHLAVGASEVAGFGASSPSYGTAGGYGKGEGAFAGRVRIQVYRGPTQKAGPHKYWAPWGYFVTQPKNPTKGSGGHSSYGSFGGYP